MWPSTSPSALPTSVRAQAGRRRQVYPALRTSMSHSACCRDAQRTSTAAKSCCCCSWPLPATRCRSLWPAAGLGAPLPCNAACALRLTSRVRRRPAILWAANCGALAWVQASHSRVFVRGYSLSLTLVSAQTHGRRSFGDLLPALAALDSWRGAARCVQMRDCYADARPLTWQRAQVGHLIQHDGAALHLLCAGPALGAPRTRARCTRAWRRERARLCREQGGARAGRNAAARCGSLHAVRLERNAHMRCPSCVAAQSKRIRRPCFWRTAFIRRW